MKTFSSHSLEETKQIAKEWLASISDAYADRDEALVVGLSGHLGAGKTAFVKSVAETLGITEDVTSPTFVIMKIYGVNDQDPITNNQKVTNKINVPWKRLVHIDAYRLEMREELEVLEWEKLVADKNNLILVEWPEKVGLQDFPESARIEFQNEDGIHRIVTV